MTFTKFFESFEDTVTMGECSIRWSRKGCGFGGFYFYYDEAGKLCCSSETMGPKFIKEILNAMVDEAIFKDCFDGTFTGADLTKEKWDELKLKENS